MVTGIATKLGQNFSRDAARELQNQEAEAPSVACMTETILSRQQELNEALVRNCQRLDNIADRLFGGRPDTATEKDQGPGSGILNAIEFSLRKGKELSNYISEQISRLEIL